jgi:hypothetical protein
MLNESGRGCDGAQDEGEEEIHDLLTLRTLGQSRYNTMPSERALVKPKRPRGYPRKQSVMVAVKR